MNQKVVNLYGPPGTGKTTSCIQQVQEWLRHGVAPDRIGYFAFTRNAADDAKDRTLSALGGPASDLTWFRTLHSAAYRLAGVKPGSVAQGYQIQQMARSIGVRYNAYATEIDDLAESNVEPGNLMMSVWDFGRNRQITDLDAAWEAAPESLTDRIDRQDYRYFIGRYEAWKTAQGKIDFTDMLSEALQRGDVTGCTHVIIDEAQDLTPLQWALANRICEDAEAILRAGDDDQAVYGWAGVRVRDYVDIPGDQRVLEQSYRVPAAVHEVAQRIIEQNRERVPKAYRPREEQGTWTRHRAEQLPALPADGSVCYLFRNKRHLSDRARELMEQVVPFGSNRHKTPLSDPRVTQGLLAMDRWRETGEVSTAGALAIYELADSGPMKGELERNALQGARYEERRRPFGAIATLEGLTPEGQRQVKRDPLAFVGGRPDHQLYLHKLIQRHGMQILRERPRIFLTTVHGAKGQEWDHVYVSTDALRNCQDGLSEDPEEETRLKYVAVTRARRSCTALAPVADGGWDL